jgi:hypothetical protein
MKKIIYILQLLSKNLEKSLQRSPDLEKVITTEFEIKEKIVCTQTFCEDIYRITIEKIQTNEL